MLISLLSSQRPAFESLREITIKTPAAAARVVKDGDLEQEVDLGLNAVESSLEPCRMSSAERVTFRAGKSSIALRKKEGDVGYLFSPLRFWSTNAIEHTSFLHFF